MYDETPTGIWQAYMEGSFAYAHRTKYFPDAMRDCRHGGLCRAAYIVGFYSTVKLAEIPQQHRECYISCRASIAAALKDGSAHLL